MPGLSVIITVPHAAGCDTFRTDAVGSKYNSHPCDKAAHYFASFLADAMSRQDINVVEIFVAKTPRSVLDMNRYVSRGDDYRNQVDNTVEQEIEKGKTVWVVDCHSFPPDYMWEGTRRETNFVVLDTRDGGKETKYVSKMVEHINENMKLNSPLPGAHVEAVRGADSTYSQSNDIMNRAREMGARSFLIEIKEVVPTSDDLSVVSFWISDFIKRSK
jgi:predicted N-formylglutamate amidohydrolase